jgi:lipopolysaccharide/colanic/teichoic acid biosynthesis glycosyltransferase
MKSTNAVAGTFHSQMDNSRFVAFLRIISILIFCLFFPFTIILNSKGTLSIVFQFLGMLFLVNLLAELFIFFPLKNAWVYRTAYLFGVAISILLYIINKDWSIAGIFPLLFALIGSFTGGLMATSFRFGLYENYAPPLTIIEDVLIKHNYLQNYLIRISLPKRLFDILVSLFGMILISPVWLLEIWFIWIEDPGPVLFVKNSTGQGGNNIKLFKFRTMVRESGKTVGPYYVKKDDTRVLRLGQVFRKTAMDELPQLLNIFLGDISFVGPRPHRTVVVSEYLRSLPEFAERHKVKPGLAGLAQVVGGNNLSPHQKLRLDRIYIRHASLGFDMKLLILAFLVVFYLRWKKDWNGRIPRNWMRYRSNQ